MIQKITPFLWFSNQAEEAAAFYASVFPDSRVGRVTALPSESARRRAAPRADRARLLAESHRGRAGTGALPLPALPGRDD